MRGIKLSSFDYQIFLFKALIWIGIAWLGFVLALGGFFYASFVWAFFLLAVLFFVYYAYKRKISFCLSREMWIVSLVLLAIVIIFSIFSTPTIFSGRDQGTISEAAVRLSQNHTFEFSTPASAEFFKIYGPGRALNFPGFYYTAQGNLITQFPLVYIVWLALFYSILGVTGFIVSNAILLYIFLFSFYLLIRTFLKTIPALPAMLFATTSFVFMWFSRFTLSENMALPLLWLSILALMLFLKNFRKLYYAVFLASATLLFFTRIEGIAFLAVSLIIILSSREARKFIKEKPISRFIVPAILFIFIFIANTLKDLNFYREIAKALLPNLTGPQAQPLGAIGGSVLPVFYLEKIFYLYGLLGFFIIGAIGIIVYFWKKEYFKLIPFFIVLPTFIYFFDAHITSDHPWMLRRFIFSLLPAAIFYSGILLGDWLSKQKEDAHRKNFLIAASVITIALIAGNLPAFSRYFTFSENKELLPQVQTFSEQFSKSDLLLIDRETTDDGWTMISGPLSFLYGENAVYFFNTQNLSKLDLQKFEHVYLIASNEQIFYYSSSTIGKRLIEKNTYSFIYSKLQMEQDDPSETVSLPAKEKIVASGKIFEIIK